jgi:hypothetical protein
MNDSLAERLCVSAWQQMADPGAHPRDVDAAAVVLKHVGGQLVDHLARDEAVRMLLEMAPDRMSRLAALVPKADARGEGRLRTALGPALTEAFRVTRGSDDVCASLRAQRRARALMELIVRIGAHLLLEPEDLLWLFRVDDDPSYFYWPLSEWCEAHDPVPATVAALVVELRAADDNSSTMDRLAAWVNPSLEGMGNLAAWENAYRGCTDAEWREAAARWERGERNAELDAPVLRKIADPAASRNTEALRRAVARDPHRARAALAEARNQAAPGVLRVVFDTWTAASWVAAGGAS